MMGICIKKLIYKREDALDVTGSKSYGNCFQIIISPLISYIYIYKIEKKKKTDILAQ